MNDADTLKELLSLSKIDIKNRDNYDSFFAEIAKELMCNYVIQKGDIEYQIIEIEFYLYTPNHKDIITYPRETDAGMWFFHQSGVDITFKSENIEFADKKKKNALMQGNGDKAVFGGILIRGIKRINDNEFFGGPQKCVYELWDQFDAFGSTTDYPRLKYTKRDFESENLWRGKRWIKIEEADRLKRVQDWSKRAGIKEYAEGSAEAYEYIQNVLNRQVTHTEHASYLYRFVYLSEDEIKKIPSSYAARPKIKQTNQAEYSFAEMSKV